MNKILRPGKSSLRTWLVSNKIFVVISVILIGLIINELRPLGQSNGIQSVAQNDQNTVLEVKTDSVVATISPTHTPTPKPTIEAFVIPTIDPDPVVNCRVSDSCKGGSIKLRLSQCKQSICCQIFGSTWLLMSDKGKCDSAQAQYNEMMLQRLSQLRKSNTVPTLPPFPTFPVIQPIQTSSPVVGTIDSGTTTIDTDFLYRECVKNVNNAYTQYMNILSGYGSAESSMGVQASIERDQGLGRCKRQYGIN